MHSNSNGKFKLSKHSLDVLQLTAWVEPRVGFTTHLRLKLPDASTCSMDCAPAVRHTVLAVQNYARLVQLDLHTNGRSASEMDSDVCGIQAYSGMGR